MRVVGEIKGEQKRKAYLVLWELQAGRCAICGGAIPHPETVKGRQRAQNGRVRPNDPSLDHVVPVSRGGTNATTNLVLTHYRCNHERSDEDMSERAWRVWRANVIGIEIMRGKRPPPACCGDCGAPHVCEAERRCVVHHKDERAA